MADPQDRRDANRRTARQIFDVWDGDDLDALDDLLAEDVTLHAPEGVRGTVHGRDAYRNTLRMIRTGLPDLAFEADEVVAEGDVVMASCTFRGTHDGDLLGIDPTGAQIEVAWFGSYRFEDGRVVEVTSLPDLFGALLQLGAIDPPGE